MAEGMVDGPMAMGYGAIPSTIDHRPSTIDHPH
jgi:hypothetical protein